jgi:hypothetical protein
MRAVWHFSSQLERGVVIARGDQRGQASLFPPDACPAPGTAGQGRPAEGPIQTFFELLYAVRHSGVLLPERLTDDWLARNHFAATNPGRLSHTLRYLGLIDAAGQPVIQLWHLNQRDPASLYAALLAHGYADLEERVRRSPSWGTVWHWIAERSGASDQMTRRRYGFYRTLRLASHTGLAVWEVLKAAAQTADWNAFLPPVLGGPPALHVATPSGSLSPQSHEARTAAKRSGGSRGILTLPMEPVLEIVEGGARSAVACQSKL